MNNPPPRSLVLATGNPGKLREIRQILAPLGVEVRGLDSFGDIEAPEEHGSTFAENARSKAIYYARATHQWCLADDSGLVVDALGGAPGVRSARYAADRLPPDAPRDRIDLANNAKLLSELERVPDERRTARFICHLALSDEKGVLLETSGSFEGRIAHRPRGKNGFGYDPVFIADETHCTAAELPPQEKNRISHRGRAVRHFASLLGELLERSSDSR